MSAISATTSLPASNQLIDPANEPASVRNGDQKAKNAYATGVAFENVLVSELAQQMSATVPGLDGSDDGLGGSTDSSGGSAGSAGSTGGVGGSGGLGAYSSLLPQTLANSITSGGGTGIAMEIAKAIDPALGAPAKK
jgi:Rod binding domain-containing protein